MIVVVPTLIAVTLPFSTDATSGLLEIHVTVLFDALPGAIVAVRVASSPSVSSIEVLSSDTLSTGKTFSFTVTSHVAVLSPSSVLTVIIAVPAFTAVTFPFSTVATSVLLELQVTFLFEALSGVTVAVRVASSPSVSSIEVLSSDTLSTG